MTTLLELHSDEWCLELTGEPPSFPPLLRVGLSSIEVEGHASVRVYDPRSNQLQDVASNAEIDPLLQENRTYHVYVSPSDAVDVEFPGGSVVGRHRTTRGRGVSHFELNFRNDVGFFDIVIRLATSSCRVTLEVFPTKLSYREDYIALRDDVAAITRSLIWAAHTRTYASSSEVIAHAPTTVEWIALLRRHGEAFVDRLKEIADQPIRRLQRVSVPRRADRVRRPDDRALQRSLRRIASRTAGLLPATGIPVPHRIAERDHLLTVDTPENRYLKAIAQLTLMRLRAIDGMVVSGDEDADITAEQVFFQEAASFAAGLAGRLADVLAAPMWREVRERSFAAPLSDAFLRNPLYYNCARLARLLHGGVAVEAGLVRIGVKNIALLYEYWCFLKIVAILSESRRLEQTSFVQVKHLGTVVALEKGVQAAVRFVDTLGEEIVVIYNRLFSHLPTTNQQPDNVIEIVSSQRFAILDAKYRIQWDEDYVRRYGGAGPPEGDINTMHRYRDAIVVSSPEDGRQFKRVVDTAITIFPASDEADFRQHRFFQSIGAVNVGAVPAMPGRDELLRDVVSRVVGGA
jgi:hypothetical protein